MQKISSVGFDRQLGQTDPDHLCKAGKRRAHTEKRIHVAADGRPPNHRTDNFRQAEHRQTTAPEGIAAAGRLHRRVFLDHLRYGVRWLSHNEPLMCDMICQSIGACQQHSMSVHSFLLAS